jgi:hypothetical protein
MSGICTPGYKTGFYSPRRGGVAKYPQLWHGCVGAWAPCLGQTGSRLYDQSLYQNHGTLTNMDPATDWVASNGKMALDFDGSNDYTESPSVVFGNVAVISYNIKIRSTSSYHTWLGQENKFIFRGDIYGADYQLVWFWGGNVYKTDGITITLNSWQHHVFSFLSGPSILFHINGTLMATGSYWFGAAESTGTPLQIGGRSAAANYSDCQMDDIRIYNRELTSSEIRLLAQRRGIAYERSRTVTAFVGSAPAAPNRRNNMLVGCGF